MTRAPVQSGQRLRVVRVDGLTLEVEPDSTARAIRAAVAQCARALPIDHSNTRETTEHPPCSLIVAALHRLILLFSAIKILNEYERGVIFTLGRYTGTKGPGIIIVVPFVQRMVQGRSAH